ncbi:MFS transporter [Aliarcobacter butzleri]|uniref:MFS transporter n=1 Tax=Aliarcobacter butzleri TaxID=28197 RepID=A0AAW7Q3Y2_9BACT|nr:MFS transporter [Aliarcobacter butzleri]MCR8710327.1 MFS transporter [Aliarcobacter butzleri]MDN5113817.1 MFS transporter [Aliarcobacter butzleri]
MKENQEFNPIWGAVWAMALCAFVLISSEFMPVSLLTPLASDLGISEGHAGQTISISGLFALVTSLFLTTIIGHIDRKSVLLFFTILMGISGVIVAFAPNSIVLMIGRALLGICIGGFWGMSAATIMRLVPKRLVPKALSILNGGNALATIVAAPVGSYLGGIIGWRGAFFCIVPIAIIAFIWQYKSLPNLPSRHSYGHRPKLSSVFNLLKRWQVTLGMVSTMLYFMGVFTLFTYLRPFLGIETKLDVDMISLALFTLGISGLIGTFIINHLLKTRLYSLLIAVPILMMLLAIGFIVFGHSTFLVFILISFWGLLSTSAPVAWWTWLSKTLPNDTESSGGLMVAVIQLAITLGATFGGIVFDVYGYKVTFAFSALILAIATLMAMMTVFYNRNF